MRRIPRFAAYATWGHRGFRAAVKQCGALLRQHKHTIANTDIHITRSVVDEIAGWLLQEQVLTDKNVSMLLDQAGMGKTVVMRDVLCDLEGRASMSWLSKPISNYLMPSTYRTHRANLTYRTPSSKP